MASFKFISLLFFTFTFCIIQTQAIRKARLQKATRKYSRKSDVLEYLTAFGYFDDLNVDASRMSLRDFSDSIKDLQERMGLNETGVLDKETLRVINFPRCSNKDTVLRHHHSHEFQKLHLRPEKYTLYGTKWDKNVISYHISRYSQQRLTRNFTDAEIRRAFQSWEVHIPLTFVPISADEYVQADIDIQFTHGSHGDNFPFPPGGSQLAHAFYPPGSGLSGDIHFNEEVDWTAQNMLFYTALHEIGHTLGLRHSSSQQAIMFSHLIQDVRVGVGLNEDDIRGVQQIYGSKPIEVTTTVAPSTSSSTTQKTMHATNILERHAICQDGRFDAIASISNGRILIFRGDELITLNQNGGYVHATDIQRIRNVYNGRIPASIDAAFTLNHKTYLFKGTLYWRTSGFVVDEGYPKVIRRNFNGIPDNINAAFLGEDSKSIFFLKGSEYWDYDLSKKVATRHDIRTHWRGIPYDRIDATLGVSNGTTFFFREGRYWKLSISGHKFTSTTDPEYPRDNRLWWLQCTNFKTSFANQHDMISIFRNSSSFRPVESFHNFCSGYFIKFYQKFTLQC